MMLLVMVTTGAIRHAKLQSNLHHQHSTPNFLQTMDTLRVVQPTRTSTEGRITTFHGLAHPKLIWGFSVLVFFYL